MYRCCVLAVLAVAVVLCPSGHAGAKASKPVSVLCMEVDRGIVLHAEHDRIKRPPASMIKLMLMLMVAEGYERNDWTPDTPIPVSARAESMGGTQVYLNAGETWPLGHLMRAVTIASANDAAMAIAEGLWGSEAAYLEAANARALALGMADTVLSGVHGLPPDRGEPFDVTTAYDMALLARACVSSTVIMNLARQREMKFRPEDAVKYNTNKLLWRMDDCDGLKTGYIRAAGFCIAATAKRDGRRLVCIVMGSPSKYGRFQLAEDTMDRYLDDYESVRLLSKGDAIGVSVPVKRGRIDTVAVSPASDVTVDLPRQLLADLSIEAHHPESLKAPLREAAVVGELSVTLGGTQVATAPLMVPDEVLSRGWYLSYEGGVAKWMGLDEKHEAGQVE